MSGIALILVVASPSLATTPGERCAAAKLRAAGQKAKSLVQCHVQALEVGGPVDAACLARVEGRFASTWSRIVAHRGCEVTDDGDDVEALVDGFVASLVAAVPASTSTTTSTTVTPSSTCPPLTALYCGVSGCPPFQALCPPGMTCDQQTCACVGTPPPCESLNWNECRWGVCPDGKTCGRDTGSTSCPPTCGCQ